MATVLRESDVAQVLDMKMALQAVEDASREQGLGWMVNGGTSRLRVRKGVLTMKSAALPAMGAMGYKVSISSFKKSGGLGGLHVLLYSTATGELLAVMEARILTQIRTGAATGVAAKYMARRNVHTVGIFGTGWQARTQLEAICSVRDIRKVNAYSIDPARQQKAFCREMTHLLGAEVIPVDNPKEVLKDADMIVTATTSPRPVFDGELLGEGVHISAMGSGTLTRREVDEITVKKSDVIIVDSLENAKGECGDLMVPIEKGIINWGQVRELGDVVVGRVKGREREKDITLFECQGIGAWDISVALRIYELAKERGIGASVSF